MAARRRRAAELVAERGPGRAGRGHDDAGAGGQGVRRRERDHGSSARRLDRRAALQGEEGQPVRHGECGKGRAISNAARMHPAPNHERRLLH